MTTNVYHRCRPPVVKGGFLVDELRGKVPFGSFTNALIPWPKAGRQGRGGSGVFVLCSDLLRALKKESIPAISHHWGVIRATVGNWRRALELTSRTGRTTGAERLANLGVELARLPESRDEPSWLFPGAGGRFTQTWSNCALGLRARGGCWATRPDREAAAMTGRRCGAVQVIRNSLGLHSFRARNKFRWTPAKNRLLGKFSYEAPAGDVLASAAKRLNAVAVLWAFVPRCIVFGRRMKNVSLAQFQTRKWRAGSAEPASLHGIGVLLSGRRNPMADATTSTWHGSCTVTASLEVAYG